MCSNIPAAMKDQKSFKVIVQECPPSMISADKKEMVDKLVQKSEARMAEMERKKNEKDQGTSVYEQTYEFNLTFYLESHLIDGMLNNAKYIDKSHPPDVDKVELISYFDEIVKRTQGLQKFLSDSTLFLPTYDIKKAQEALKVMQDKIQSVQNELIPKKKFAFKSKKKMQNGVKSPPQVERSSSNNASDSLLGLKLCKCGFKDVSGENLVKFREEVEKQDVGLHHLNKCKVHLYGAPSTIFISGLSDCLIFAGPVSTSVFIENCIRCTFVFACQQLRVHSCTDSDFYLHITSRTIIEDSKNLCFAPYNWSYDGQEEDFIRAGIDKEINNWDSIDDFNWLVIGTPSPNWKYLNQEQYQTWS